MKGKFIGVAIREGLLYCNTIPLEREEETERDLLRNCYSAWGRLNMLKKPLPSEHIAKKVHSIYVGESEDLKGVNFAVHKNERFQSALITMLLIPRGRFITYGDIARILRTSPRVVGSYAARNPFPLLVPCHRVIRGDMSVGGYGYGPELKARLLMLEGVEVDLRRMKVNPNKLMKAGELMRLREVWSTGSST
ncbi:MAG: MGMT family protein [Candidatus Korarchaeum sp.]|nr:MGMT family protein [Candidatus Korarchaeum sp.]MDW8036006.1 MGMT family protein [Candidatus Korarchaeum sp.]